MVTTYIAPLLLIYIRDTTKYMTKGNIYKVIEEWGDFYQVIDDENDVHSILKSDFVVIDSKAAKLLYMSK